MTLQDILLEQKLDSMNREDAVRLRYQAELAHMERPSRPHVLSATRRRLASALVRTGVWIDRKAGERAIAATTH